MLGLLLFALAASPPTFDRTYSFLVGAERVGVIHLHVEGDHVRYQSTRVIRRGTATEVTSFWSDTNRAGHGMNSDGRVLHGPIPSTLALTQFVDGEPRRCIPVEDEHDGRPGEVCGERKGLKLQGELLGEVFASTLDDKGIPRDIILPNQNVRFYEEVGEVPLPQPSDLFAAAIAAPPLPSFARRHATHLLGHSAGCEVNASLSASTAAPPSDVELPTTGASGLMLQIAYEATAGDRTTWAAAKHLATFVDRAIASSPPASDEHNAHVTWSRRSGGCVGHAAVFSELARALGLHVRLVYGMLFEEGTWHAHAWNEVEVRGQFYGVDPSRGLAPLGPDHVALARDDDPEPLRPGRCMLALPSMTWTLTPGR